MSMAESSGEEEIPHSVPSYSRKHQQTYGEENGDGEDVSLKPYLGLSNVEPAEKKVVIENYGSGKHFTGIVDRVVNLFCLCLGINILHKSVE
jgi:hypothetical protein